MRWRRGGFTLLELLVVISIMALAVAGVSLALPDSGQTRLEREAARLAALLEAARAHARASGRAVLWQTVPQGGFRFDGLPPGAHLPGGWLQDGVQAQIQVPHPAQARFGLGNSAPAQVLLLGPEPILAAQSVILTLAQAPGAAALRVGTDGIAPFAVQPLP